MTAITTFFTPSAMVNIRRRHTVAYTPEELAKIFLDYYTFLTTLHYDQADLQIPPPEGWPSITVAAGAGLKFDTTINVLRHLPYFNGRAAIHYKSRLIDYTSADLEKILKQTAERAEDMEFWSNERRENPKHFVYIACGHESGGRDLILNVKDGEITEDIESVDTLSPRDIKEYFQELKEAYRSLRLIPCVGRVTIEADSVEERASHIDEEEVLAQSEEWGTNLDKQYIRQVYRQHGWPDAFRREDAEKAVEELTELVRERRNDWEWEVEGEEWLEDDWASQNELGSGSDDEAERSGSE